MKMNKDGSWEQVGLDSNFKKAVENFSEAFNDSHLDNNTRQDYLDLFQFRTNMLLGAIMEQLRKDESTIDVLAHPQLIEQVGFMILADDLLTCPDHEFAIRIKKSGKEIAEVLEAEVE